MNAKTRFERIYAKTKKIADKSVGNNNYELGLQAIAAGAYMSYLYNQFYTDEQLEKMLLEVSDKVITFTNWDHTKDRKKIVFYDGFGLDRRGISIVMNKAICMNGYKLVYISPLKNKELQPTLKKELQQFDVDWRFIDTEGMFLSEINQIKEVFEEIQPELAFLYTYPYDVAGIVVFNALLGKCYRYQLDLTDHAFWLGVNAFDMCNGGRQFSASIQYYFRGIPIEKMSQLDASLFIDNCPFQGLPFSDNDRFIFSGGALYKTLGDNNKTFYKIVEHALDNHKDIKFLYAGTGDDSQIKTLIDKYDGRVYLIAERNDFYQIMQRCTLYLNTYPMFGGLMMRYAVLAGKIPLTLKHDNDSDGILIKQEQRRIEYNTYEALIQDMDRLLLDNEYLREREKLLEGAVVTEDCFVRNIKMMIEEHKTEFSYEEIKPVDTSKFREEFLDRFTYEDISTAIATRRNKKLVLFFPQVFIHRYINKLGRTMRRQGRV